MCFIFLLMLPRVLVVILRGHDGYLQFYINLSSINFYHFSFYWGALSFLIILGCLILLLQPSDFFFVQIFSSFTLNVQQWNKLSFNPLIHYTVIYQCCVSLSHSVFLSFYYWTLDFKGLLS